eukprot:jgi/Botrbrau1/23296/Bobra.0102s0037.1
MRQRISIRPMGREMSVAAAGADLLASLIARRLSAPTPTGSSAPDALLGLTAEFQRKLADTLAVPWKIATKDDIRFLRTIGELPAAKQSFSEWYTQKVTQAAAKDHRVFKRILSLVSMLEGPASLLAPEVTLPILANALRESVMGCFSILHLQPQQEKPELSEMPTASEAERVPAAK